MLLKHHSRTRLTLLALLIALSSPPAIAQDGIASVGIELDEESGYLAFGMLGGQWTAATSWELSAARSQTQTRLAEFATTSLGTAIYHDFGRVGLRFGIGAWRDADIAKVSRLSASLDFHEPGWSLTFTSELKRSDFDSFSVDRTVVRRDGSLVQITATADCKVDDGGAGARLAVFNDDWSFALSGMRFDYDSFGCEFGLQSLDLLRSATRDEFVQLADRVTDILALGSARRLLSQTSFLESRIGLSLRRETAARSYSIYFDRVEDAFFNRAASSLSGGIGFPLRAGVELELYAGLTQSDLSSDVAFVGLMFLVER